MADWFADNKPKVITDKADWFGANKPAEPVTDPLAESRRNLSNPVDDAGRPLHEPGAIAKWFDAELRPMLEKVAHPKTISDIAALLIPNTGNLLAQAAPAAAGDAVRAVGGSVGRGLSSTGRGIENVATSAPVQRMSEMGAIGELAMRGDMKGAAAAYLAPRLAASGGRIMQRAGGALERVSTAVPGAAEASPAAVEAAAPAIEKAVAVNPAKTLETARDAFKAAGVEPLRGEVSNTHALLMRGKSPEDALKVVLGNRPASAAADTAAASLPKLTAAEVKAGLDMVGRGKTPKEAMEAILAQREFMKRMGGTMTDSEVRAALDFRNNSGQIKTPSAQTAELRRIP